MRICENCKKEHNGEYGSGRFCSSKCSRGFSTKAKRGDINKKVSLKLSGSGNTKIQKICLKCDIEFSVSFRKRFQKYCSRKCGSKGWTNHSKVDWSSVNKKSYQNGKKYVSGGTTKWIRYKDIKVQGTYEYQACVILDKMKDENKIIYWGYSEVRIPYIGDDGKKHTYIVDFLVRTPDEEYLLEVKGREIYNDQLKWKAAIDLGWKIIVWRKNDLFNKGLLV